MPFLDFFRNLFGRGPTQEPPQHRLEDEQQQYRNSFRNPIWQNDEDEDDVSDFSSRIPGNRYQFRIFSDPFEMTRFFETQMDDMMRSFFGFGFGNNSSIFEHFGTDDFSNALPMPDDEQPSVKGPRDEVLKPSYDMPESNFGFGNFSRTLPDKKSNDNPQVLKPSYEMPDPNTKKFDSDLDGKIKSDELARIWKSPERIESFPKTFIRTFGSSVSTQIVRRPDGSVEERRTVRDTDGNEETRITRQIGDKMHTIVTKKAKDGSEIKSEDIVNMDENELKGFDEKWKKSPITKLDDRANSFPWHKFFGPNPKL